MMGELTRIKDKIDPHQILYVADSMAGQDAVTAAAEFDKRLDFDGIVLTKIDGDARGGAALSIKMVTGKPIIFLGAGEKTDALEPFHPDRLASRILGMGDVMSLIEKAEKIYTEEEATVAAEKMLSNEFSLEDFRDQLRQLKKLGSMENLLKMIPGVGKMLPPGGLNGAEEKLGRTEAIIGSMTMLERQNAKLINGSRRKRIAKGSGTSVSEVSKMLKDFAQMKKMLKRMNKQGPGAFGGGGMPGGLEDLLRK
jgi:signal recognition particle subunit SRP54